MKETCKKCITIYMNVENRVLEQEKPSAPIYISSILKYLLAFEKSQCKVGLVYSITTHTRNIINNDSTSWQRKKVGLVENQLSFYLHHESKAL